MFFVHIPSAPGLPPNNWFDYFLPYQVGSPRTASGYSKRKVQRFHRIVEANRQASSTVLVSSHGQRVQATKGTRTQQRTDSLTDTITRNLTGTLTGTLTAP